MSDPPRVLLGALDPILSVGIARALKEGGAAVVDHGTEADALVARAAESLPDAVVVGPRPSGLSARLRVAAPAAERLHGELFGRRTSEGGTCPAT